MFLPTFTPLPPAKGLSKASSANLMIAFSSSAVTYIKDF